MATELDDDTLQRFYDGDLTPLEESTVRTMIGQDPAAQKRLAKLERLSEMFTLAAKDMGAGLDAGALFAGIQADIKRDETLGFGARMQVIAGEWVEHKRGAMIALGGATAIAAAALLMVLAPGQNAGDSTARNMPPPREEKKMRVAEAEPAKLPARQGSQVENVDFGQNTGTVFEIENEGVTTAVVWIADEEEDMP